MESIIEIIDIKDKFNSIQAYTIYSECMYIPDYNKFLGVSKQFSEDNQIHILGFYSNESLVGIIAIKTGIKDLSCDAIIKGIAVEKSFRNKGVARGLIKYAIKKLSIERLLAETDDEAVGFYRRCGFSTQECYKIYDQKIIKRYKCYL